MEEKPYIRAIKLKAPEGLDWASYPYVIPAVNDLENIEFHPDVTFLLGKMVQASPLFSKRWHWH